MSTNTGRFVWYELLAADCERQGAFYRDVLGWQSTTTASAICAYTQFTVAGRPVAGMMATPADARELGVHSCWSGYVHVADVDDSVRQALAAGGSLLRPAAEIPDVGRFAVVADPDGAVFILFRASCEPPAAESAEAAVCTPGLVGWHELRGGGANPLDFYGELFGWTLAESLDMGETGPYLIFAIDGQRRGGMMQGGGKPFWLFYFNVTTLDAALARVAAAGGSVLSAPMPVPGGAWIAHCQDPEQAMFALVAPQR